MNDIVIEVKNATVRFNKSADRIEPAIKNFLVFTYCILISDCTFSKDLANEP